MASARVSTARTASVRDDKNFTQRVEIAMSLQFPYDRPERALDAAEQALESAYQEMLGVLRARARAYTV